MTKYIFHNRFIIWIILWMTYIPTLRAQQPVIGKVIDKEKGYPIEAVNIQLFSNSAQQPVRFCLTDTEGNFSLLSGNSLDSLRLSVSLLGYKRQIIPVQPGEYLEIVLETEYFNLKEVEIRPGRVWGHRDTLRFNLNEFLSAHDNSIEDVLKKLPGITIDEIGKISYNGRDISNFYIEGLELMGGNYNQLSRSLEAASVESVEILENHQPIRILQDKIRTEDIAMNLKLKPEFKDRWMGKLRFGTGYEPFLWEGAIDLLQISRNSQSAYLYKSNNTGQDLMDEQIELADQLGTKIQEPGIPLFLSQPSFSSPLKKEKLLFNDSHSLSGNRMYRIGKYSKLRINGNYNHDIRHQSRGSNTLYYLPEDTVPLLEESFSKIRTDQAKLSFFLEHNSDKKYLTNLLDITAKNECSLSQIQTPSHIEQQIKAPDYGFKNYFQTMHNRNSHTIEGRSLIRFHHIPASISLNNQKQPLTLNQLYLDQSAALLYKKGYLSQQYTGGFIGEITNLSNLYGVYFTPRYQWNTAKWTITPVIPIQWKYFDRKKHSKVLIDPSLSISLKYNYRWRFTLYGGYKESLGNITEWNHEPLYRDYRTIYQYSENIPLRKQQNYSLYIEYKNTIKEFFITFAPGYYSMESNQIMEQIFSERIVTNRFLDEKSYSKGGSLSGTISKGFYDLNLKTSLNYLVGVTKTEQINKEERLPYKYTYMQYTPHIVWNPNRTIETSYQGTINYSRSHIGDQQKLDPLWNITQKINFIYTFFPVSLIVSGEHYYNNPAGSRGVNKFFSDLSLIWKSSNWEIKGEIRNLFDQSRYIYSSYNALQSYTFWIDIRPREWMGSFTWKI